MIIYKDKKIMKYLKIFVRELGNGGGGTTKDRSCVTLFLIYLMIYLPRPPSILQSLLLSRPIMIQYNLIIYYHKCTIYIIKNIPINYFIRYEIFKP